MLNSYNLKHKPIIFIKVIIHIITCILGEKLFYFKISKQISYSKFLLLIDTKCNNFFKKLCFWMFIKINFHLHYAHQYFNFNP